MTTAEVLGQNGTLFEVTLPEGTSFSQQGHVDGQPFRLDGASPPLVLDVHYNLNTIFGSGQGYHAGTLELEFRDRNIASGHADSAANTANGIRGPLTLVIHNDTSVPFGDDGSDADVIITLANLEAAVNGLPRANDTAGHPVYAHLHTPPSGSLGDARIEAFLGAANGAYNGYSIHVPPLAPSGSGTIPFPSFHERDTPGDDSFLFTVMLGEGAFTLASAATLQAQWDALNTPSGGDDGTPDDGGTPGTDNGGGTPGNGPMGGYDPAVIDWNAVAADQTANWEATGQWFVTPGKFPVEWGVYGSDYYDPNVIDWNAVAADQTANWEATGQWWVTPGKFPAEWGVG